MTILKGVGITTKKKRRRKMTFTGFITQQGLTKIER
jgi:hypothetical protein